MWSAKRKNKTTLRFKLKARKLFVGHDRVKN